jgi:hypothetical protein
MTTNAADVNVRRARKSALRPIRDATAVAGRNLIAYRRVPQLLVFSTIQPVIFVLLFRYVFGGAVKTPPGRPLCRRSDAGHLRPDDRLRRHRRRRWPGDRPQERPAGAVPVTAHGAFGGPGRSDHGRPRPQRLRRRADGRGRLRGRLPRPHQRAGVPGRHAAGAPVRVRALVGLRHGRPGGRGPGDPRRPQRFR